MNNIVLDRLSVGDFVEEILMDAANKRASDIHFEVVNDFLKIRYRKDGDFYDLSRVPSSLASTIYSHLKSLAQLNTIEKNLPQDGRISITHQSTDYHFRLATTPTHSSESIVLRVLQGIDSLSFAQLGIPNTILHSLLDLAKRKQGMLIIAGPTGAGKTTTLYGILREILTDTKKFLTVEDPVEFIIPGTTQVSIRESIGLTFQKVLRAFLRQDPDVIMIGEIRDTETAKIAIQAALTGHLVLCTLHTESAVSAIARLIDLGLEGPQIANILLGVLAQRLVKTAEGSGRKGIFEWMGMTSELKHLICKNSTRKSLQTQAILDGMIPLYDHGMQLVGEGLIFEKELKAVLGK